MVILGFGCWTLPRSRVALSWKRVRAAGDKSNQSRSKSVDERGVEGHPTGGALGTDDPISSEQFVLIPVVTGHWQSHKQTSHRNHREGQPLTV